MDKSHPPPKAMVPCTGSSAEMGAWLVLNLCIGAGWERTLKQIPPWGPQHPLSVLCLLLFAGLTAPACPQAAPLLLLGCLWDQEGNSSVPGAEGGGWIQPISSCAAAP